MRAYHCLLCSASFPKGCLRLIENLQLRLNTNIRYARSSVCERYRSCKQLADRSIEESDEVIFTRGAIVLVQATSNRLPRGEVGATPELPKKAP